MLLSLGSILTLEAEAPISSANGGDLIVDPGWILVEASLVQQGAAGVAKGWRFILEGEGLHGLTCVEPLAEVIHGSTRSLQYV